MSSPPPRAGAGLAASPTRSQPISRDSILQRYQPSGAGTRTDPSVTRAPSAYAAPDSSRTSDVSRTRALSGASSDSGRLAPTTRETTGRSTRDSRSTDTSRTERAREAQRDGLNRLTRLNQTNPDGARAALRRGEAVSRATDVGVRTGVAVGVTATCGSSDLIPPCDPNYDACYYDNGCSSAWWWGACSWLWWGCSAFWWPCWGPSWGYGYWYGNYGYWGGGSPYYYAPYATYAYAPPPIYYSTVLYDSAPAVGGETVVTVVDPNAPAAPPAADARAAGVRPPASSSPTRTVSESLALGDQAFREGRYNDAVLAYAKAVESWPNEGVLHLVFSDALFAAGEYHFAACALRRALELEPQLVVSVVDKHTFYGDARELDRHLAQLERFLETHFGDDDARLLLAANYLFAGRAAQAAEFLATPSSATVRESSTGKLLLSRATELSAAPTSKK